ncbi:MAG: hypothetical protein IJY21_00315 [Clostridia bacterium]|nr:hypothetical protein [Clostridia bacterium]
MAARKKKKIVFVCTGNTCRSPMAQLLLAQRLKEQKLKGFDVRSAGTAAKKGDVINPKSAQVLQENGIECVEFSSTKLTEKLLLDAFAVVCMTERQREYLMDLRWNALKKAGKSMDEAENNVYSFAEITGYEILDPYGKDIDCYRYVFGLLSAGMLKLTEKLDLKGNAWEEKPKAPKSAKTGTSANNTTTKTSPKTKKKTPKQADETPATDGENQQLSIFKE